MSFNLQSFPKLKEAIEKNNLVIFVGAGTSIKLKNINGEEIGTWNNLVSKIIDKLNNLYDNKFHHLISLVGKYEPIDILNLLEKDKEINKSDIYDFLKDFLDVGENNFELHKKVISLSKIIVTTNYDVAFEKCDNELSKRVAYKGKNFEITTHKKSDKPLLFKLHGCFKDSDSMVLFPSNYNDLYNNHGDRDSTHTLTAFKNLIYNKSILFIGCGMGDFQINHIFKEIKYFQNGYDDNHFIISKEKPDSSLNFFSHILINDYAEIPIILDKLIEYKTEIENKNDIEKLEFTKEIELLNKKLEMSTSKNQIIINELFDEATIYYENEEFDLAIKKYKQISYLEDLSFVYNNWGNAINRLSVSFQDEAEIIKLLNEAVAKYEKVISIDEDYYIAYNNLGLTYYNLSKINKGEELNYLFKSSESFKKAISINKKYFKAYFSLATVLFKISTFNTGVERVKFLKESSDIFEEANKIDSDDTKVLYSWGSNMLELIKVNNSDQEDYINKGIEIFTKCYSFGGKVYNFACLYAVLNRKEEALSYLKIALENNEVQPDFVNDDKDWLFYKESVSEYKELLSNYKK